MALQFLYTLNGDVDSILKDMPLDTLVNYQNGVGTNGYKRGDAVALTATGLIIRAKDGAAAKAIGILEDTEFTGLVTTGRYGARNAAFTSDATNTTRYPNGIGKIRIGQGAVYAIPMKSGQTVNNSHIGKAFGISQDAAGDQTLDNANTTNTVFKVIDFDRTGTIAHVIVKESTVI